MRPEIHAAMAHQDGLITRRQALEAGLSAERLDRSVRTGELTIVRRGVYAESSLVVSLTGPRQRHLLQDRAASLRIRAPHVASHDFAAAELDLAVLDPRTRFTHVTRPGVVGAHLRHGVKHHLAPYPPEQVVDVGGRRVLGLARTAVDLAREHGNPAGVVAVDSARRAGASLAAFAAVLAPMRSWPHVTVAREAVDLSDPDSDSPGETLTRLLVSELGLGVPQTQFGLTDGRRTGWFDLRLGRQLIEFDGRGKYLRIDEGGYALEDADAVVWREKQRQDWAMGFRLGMSRVVWSDLVGIARPHTLARIEREYRATCHLFGTSIDDLTPYLARGPRPRPRLRAA